MAQLMLHTAGWSLEQAALHHMHWFLVFTEPVKHFVPLQETGVIDLCDSADPMSSDGSESGFDSDSSCSAEVEPTVLSESQELLSPPPPKRLKQSKLPFAAISREDWRLQEEKHTNRLREERQFHEELEQEAREKKKLRDREKARLKKQGQRARKKAKTAQAQLERSSTVSKELSTTGSSQCSSNAFHTAKHLAEGVAELSRPHRQSKKMLKSAKGPNKDDPSPPEEKKSKRVNWTSLFLWTMIESAVQAVGYPWRPIDISNRLKTQYPELFARFSPQQISNWRDLKITN
ncbi:hypothetical protein FRC08_006857 [Ceratobasidium sp. 394]|nr:hypothetical protein FRC08_006857 [Ceratobasidium sp. 394]